VQCAIAREQHIKNCVLFETTTTQSDAGTTAVAAGDRPSDHPANSEEAVAITLSSQLSSVPLFGSSGGCPADVSFSAQGHSFVLPFSSWCPYLNLLGAAWMAACFLTARFIVFRRS